MIASDLAYLQNASLHRVTAPLSSLVGQFNLWISYGKLGKLV